MGYVVLAGLFEPGTAVSLHAAPGGTLRSNGEVPTGRRVADAMGTVGFDGLEPGDRFIASGFDLYGKRLELFCRALGDADANEVAQPPIRPARQPVGTQEIPEAAVPPAAPNAILHIGVPDGVPVGVALVAT